MCCSWVFLGEGILESGNFFGSYIDLGIRCCFVFGEL